MVARPSALPYAYFPLFSEGASAATEIARLGDEKRDPRAAVLLPGARVRTANPQCWFVQDVKRSWDQITLQLSSRGPCGASWLLVNEAYVPGWSATLEAGGTVEIQRANAWAQALQIPASMRASHSRSLQLRYREPTFFSGCLLFLLGIAAALMMRGHRSRYRFGQRDGCNEQISAPQKDIPPDQYDRSAVEQNIASI